MGRSLMRYAVYLHVTSISSILFCFPMPPSPSHTFCTIEITVVFVRSHRKYGWYILTEPCF
ncbi:hypothetical protein DAI22_06g114750 [Oryza sativa Japonica Group]|nr:hypothetical protein DAI22_06g114750 [Oryza sativa Japonica Group]